MQAYHDLLRHILQHGTKKSDRTGTGTVSVFGYQMRFNLQDGFPLLTTKKLHTKSIIHELLWFLQGDTNIKYLKDKGVRIWDEWADANGDLGPVYGKQWRSWAAPDGRAIDQITEVVQTLKKNPDSRRIIVSAWNPADIPDMALAPCHCLFQFYVAPPSPPGGGERGRASSLVGMDAKSEAILPPSGGPGGAGRARLSCQLYQRSADVFLGVPFNIASYALLTLMLAQVCDLEPGDFIWTGGDTHLYVNHLEQVELQLSRTPRPLPVMKINPAVRDIFSFQFEDFELLNYEPWPGIKAPVAV